jgi:hypothetical protein
LQAHVDTKARETAGEGYLARRLIGGQARTAATIGTGGGSARFGLLSHSGFPFQPCASNLISPWTFFHQNLLNHQG